MKFRITAAAIFCALFIFVVWAVWFYVAEKRDLAKITSFEECAQNGFPLQESFPRQCMTPDGRSFVEKIEKPVLISVVTPKDQETIQSPLTVTGLAKGFWFFEASFPIELRGANDQVLSVGIAQAQGDWMTEEFVPFSATLTFKNTELQNGMLILRKDNPSGLPENDDAIRIPVVIGVSE
jgi:hypothetical protein